MTKLEEMTEEELEIVMKKAVLNQDCLTYKQVCDALGLEQPSILSDCYDKGAAEEIYLIKQSEQKKNKTAPRNIINKSRYSAFFNEWQRLHINEKDFEADHEQKRRTLLIFSKFQDRGKQPIKDYSNTQIGHLYVKVLEQARKYEVQ